MIALITLWTYHPTTNNLFVWDSKAYLPVFEFWISKMNAYHIVWMFLSLEVANWHPLTWLSWAIDYQLYGGLVPWGYHFSNNLLHAANSILVFLLTLVIFGLNAQESNGYPFRKDNNALIAAFLTALFFAVHPQHVESVAWIAERKDLLFQFFLLLSMLTYVKYVSCDANTKSRWFNGTLSLFVMALLSKPMAVTFPVILLLIDVYPLRRFSWVQTVNRSIRQQTTFYLIREKIPFFLFSLLLVLITLYAQKGALTSISIELRVLNAFNSIIFYLTQLCAPLQFAPLYPYFVDVGESISWKAFIPLFSVVGISLAALYAWTRARHMWLVAWLFYLVTLTPVLGLIQVGSQGAADRYAYFPTLPAYFLLGAGVLAVLKNITTTRRRLVAVLAILPLVLLLVSKTRQQIQIWESDETLWSNTVLMYPENAYAHMYLGGYYFNVRQYEKAAFYFDEVERLKPNEVNSLAWRGLTHLHLGQFEEAIKFHIKLGVATESMPQMKADQFCIQYNIGWLYAQLDMFTESSELFSRLDPVSRLGHDAGIWLDWLENNKKSRNIGPTIETLPGFCNRLLPTMYSSVG